MFLFAVFGNDSLSPLPCFYTFPLTKISTDLLLPSPQKAGHKCETDGSDIMGNLKEIPKRYRKLILISLVLGSFHQNGRQLMLLQFIMKGSCEPAHERIASRTVSKKKKLICCLSWS